MRRRAPRRSSVAHPAEAGIVCGVNPVLELLRGGADAVERLWRAAGVDAAEPVAAAARAAGVPVETADRASLDRLTGGAHHQGVAAQVRAFRYASLAELVARRTALLIALDGVTDPQNLGAIVRSGEVLGAGGLVLPQDRSAAVTPAVVRASSGATAHLPIVQVVNLARALDELKELGFWVVGLDAQAASRFADLPDLEHAVLVVGSEGRGIRPIVARACDFIVSIPVYGRVASLNAAVAAAIGLYALAERQRAAPPRAGRIVPDASDS